MSEFHTFQRPDVAKLGPQVGEVYSAAHNRYDEGARYSYSDQAHDLVLFWAGPTRTEIEGLRDQPVEVGLFSHGPAAFLLYKIQNVCEWSDVAFNVQLVPEAERELPAEPPGERGRLRITLVNADDGIVVAKRLVSLDKVMTQALRHVMQEQAAQPFNRLLYDAAVQEVHGRFADSDAMVQAAEVVEATLG
ncbi:hypothetical protein EDC61_10467 [Sulfuritortus calidifontis]|uniref:Uncharacterized protein n=1 Tax=Sulfuritortus calidifontis TaxID=1914471 RepID=A0A4R3JYE2_9PROT|nr:hypothetical protein [Sulfuritortus calidifontis]TCS72656.1 hypothetical protein EDC61_10467 [Sulfuritortus calidifontis]